MMRIVAAAVSVGMSGCGLCTEVETFYRGTRTGTLVVVEEGPAQESLKIRPMTGPWDERDPFSGGTACSGALQAAVPGQVITAWLSPDDLATVARRCSQADGGAFGPRPAACVPGSTDPQGQKTYTLPAAGSVVSQLELVDP